MYNKTSFLLVCSLLGGQAVLEAQQQADEQAIRQAETRWRKILAAQDTAAIGSFYTQDAVYAPQGAPAYRGGIPSAIAGSRVWPGFSAGADADPDRGRALG